MRYPHRSGDVLYPLAIDPVVADRFRVNEAGNPISNGSFPIGYRYETAGWYFAEDNYGRPGGGFPRWPGDGRYDHNGALYIENRYSNSFYYSNDGYGQWIWQAPRQSFIRRADFNNVYYSPTFQNFPRAMCFLEGVYSVTRWNWEPGTYTDTRGHTGTSPFIGGPAPNGSCSTHTNNGKAHDIPNPSPGNIAAFRLFAYGEGTKQNHSYAQMGGGAMFLDDSDVPSIGCAYSSPSGWVRSATLTTYVCTRDGPQSAPTNGGGLGIWVAGLYVPTENSPTGRTQLTRFADCQNRVSRCPEYNTFYFTYNTDADLDPNTAGIQRVREGANLLDGDAYDILAKPTHFQAGSLRVDRTAPNGTISGISEGELARDRDYQITATSTDALSGSRSVQITLDGAQKASRSNCPANTNPCQLNWTLDGGDPALTEGTHALRVIATDQVGNSATVATRYFQVERTPPQFEAEGTLRPLEGDVAGDWVEPGEQGLAIDATDGQTGATEVDLTVDGQVVASEEQVCPQGACELNSDLFVDTSDYSEGEHTIAAVARDGAGNSSGAQEWTVRIERTPPALAVTGDLVAGGELQPDRTYTLRAAATDAEAPLTQAGLGTIAFAVDDDAPQVVEQQCPLDGCPMTAEFDYVAAEYGPGDHTLRVTATDRAGNSTTETLVVRGADEPPPSCAAPPAPSEETDAAPVESSVALELLRLNYPRAVSQSSASVVDEELIQPGLTDSEPAFDATNTIAPIRVDRDPSDGATTTIETVDAPICVTPTAVGSGASAPPPPVNQTAAFYANSRPRTDSVVRPTATGAEFLSQLRSPLAPTELSWHVALAPGLRLQELGDGTLAVVEPTTPGAEPPYDDPEVPPSPGFAEREQSLSQTGHQLDLSSHALERGQARTGDQVVATIPRPWARDANGEEVATSLSFEGSQVTMSVEPAVTALYPVVAEWRLSSADAVNEYEALKAAAATQLLTNEELDAKQTPNPPPGPAPTPDPDDDGGAFDDDEALDDGSAHSDEADTLDQDDPDAVTAASRDPTKPLKNRFKDDLRQLEFGLTESDPGNLDDPSYREADGLRGRWPYLRPIVPWNIANIKQKHARDEALSDRQEAFLQRWNRYYQRLVENGWKADIGFARFKEGLATPPVSKYGKAIRSFFDEYPGVTQSITAWNEPNFKRDPLRKRPQLAAEYWVRATKVCADGPCKSVVAGEFVGKAGEEREFRIRGQQPRASYTVAYKHWLDRFVKSRDLRRPRIWGFHGYGDTKDYALKTSRARYRASAINKFAGQVQGRQL